MARLFTYLVVDCPGQPQQVIMWDTLEITVGRGPDRDLVIPDSEVSRQHALFRIENQAHTIADLHTSNGTFVNGARVSRHVLRPGDVVELGPARVCFRQETESPKGKNVKFASQLKGFAPFGEGEDAGNRTVLGMSGGQRSGPRARAGRLLGPRADGRGAVRHRRLRGGGRRRRGGPRPGARLGPRGGGALELRGRGALGPRGQARRSAAAPQRARAGASAGRPAGPRAAPRPAAPRAPAPPAAAPAPRAPAARPQPVAPPSPSRSRSR